MTKPQSSFSHPTWSSLWKSYEGFGEISLFFGWNVSPKQSLVSKTIVIVQKDISVYSLTRIDATSFPAEEKMKIIGLASVPPGTLTNCFSLRIRAEIRQGQEVSSLLQLGLQYNICQCHRVESLWAASKRGPRPGSLDLLSQGLYYIVYATDAPFE